MQVHSQELVGSSLTIKDGLVDPSIYSMVQGKSGLMWFGSWKGLSSYDTREFKNYKNDPNNPRSISSDFIRACHSDDKGRLWFGTNWGLNLYDPVTDSFDRFLKDSSNANSLSDNMIICLMEDDEGDLWVGTSNGVNRVRTSGNKVTIERYLYTDNPKEKKKNITAMYKDPEGIIWVSASHALMAIDTRKKKTEYMSFPFEADPENKSVLTIYGDKAGNMWIGSRWKGLGRFDRKLKKFHSFRNLEETNEEKSDVLSVMQIIPSRDGNLLLRTSRGVLSYNVIEDKLENGISDNLLKKKLRISGLLSIYLDSEGNLWIGTLADGLHHMTKRNNFFVPISLKNGETNVEQILLDPSNNLWFQSYDRDRLGGMQNTWYHLAKTNRSLVRVSMLAGYATRSYFDRSGTLWIGLWRNVIVNYKVVAGKLVEQGRYVLPHIPSSTEDQITVIGEDKTRLLVGTAFNGLYIFDREIGMFRPYNILTRTKTGSIQKYISFLFNDSKNNLWIGTSFGVTKISPNHRRQFFQTASVTQASSFNRTVNSIHEDTYGQIWMVLSNDGLYRYDSAKSVFVPKNQSKAINGYNVTNMQHDNQGNLWLSNELGIIEYNILKDKARQFFFHDGIPGSRLMTNSSLKTKDGYIYFTTNNGAVYFNPKNIPFNRQPPSVVFTRLKLFNKPVTIGDQTEILKQSLAESDAITFRHNQSIFSIDFAALSFTNIEKNEYAYKLDGFEKDWNYVKTPTASYTNLPAGTYTLLIK
ncbi:two-component regulator propeller domain-containing protein, partial [Dyadobacter sp. CY312]|uniref:ligand-binding sensor domain-containing protein n=1 Tax=Dyadobacter sp. CY312 TaxID=2907303 RepID=UPI001F32AF7A